MNALLDELAAVGLRRRPEEAPGEHIARCLRQADLAEPHVNGLVDLFLLARFSTHPVTEEHRKLAVAHLNAARPAQPVAAADPPPQPVA